MRIPRRRFLHLVAGTAALPALSRIARAQAYPTRPITMIVPAAAGGSTDVIGRVLAERMRGSLGQPIILENVSGADGSIGVGRAARARPDGYTIDLGFQGTHVLNGAFYSLQYDLLKDFAPISPLITYPNVLFARKSMPANDLKELITWMQSRQGVGGNRGGRSAPLNCVLSEGKRDAIYSRTLSWRSPFNPGLGSRRD